MLGDKLYRNAVAGNTLNLILRVILILGAFNAYFKKKLPPSSGTEKCQLIR